MLQNESKIDPKVCTIPRPPKAEILSSEAGWATGLGAESPSAAACPSPGAWPVCSTPLASLSVTQPPSRMGLYPDKASKSK